VVIIPVKLLTTRLGRGGKHFLLLPVLLSIRRRDGVSLVLRLGVLGGSSAWITMVRDDVQDTLVCIVIGEMVF
jgi:hypothetical protein